MDEERWPSKVFIWTPRRREPKARTNGNMLGRRSHEDDFMGGVWVMMDRAKWTFNEDIWWNVWNFRRFSENMSEIMILEQKYINFQYEPHLTQHDTPTVGICNDCFPMNIRINYSSTCLCSGSSAHHSDQHSYLLCVTPTLYNWWVVQNPLLTNYGLWQFFIEFPVENPFKTSWTFLIIYLGWILIIYDSEDISVCVIL